jgi:hypothetical protein
LEGLAVEGAHLTKLVLGLGRVFGVLAADPDQHAPEINQFHLAEEGPETDADVHAAEDLLRAGVMHLALVRTAGSKPVSQGDTKAYDYALHPALSASDLLGLVSMPRQTIPRVVERHGRAYSDQDLPEQLALFSSFYGS